MTIEHNIANNTMGEIKKTVTQLMGRKLMKRNRIKFNFIPFSKVKEIIIHKPFYINIEVDKNTVISFSEHNGEELTYHIKNDKLNVTFWYDTSVSPQITV